MSLVTALLIVVSVLLSAAAQILLKFGMSSSAVQGALAGSFGIGTAASILFTPAVFAGLFTFGLSAVVWLAVLSRIDVSLAYPCVALGIVITMLAGHFLLGETLTTGRITASLMIIVAAIILAAGY